MILWLIGFRSINKVWTGQLQMQFLTMLLQNHFTKAKQVCYSMVNLHFTLWLKKGRKLQALQPLQTLCRSKINVSFWSLWNPKRMRASWYLQPYTIHHLQQGLIIITPRFLPLLREVLAKTASLVNEKTCGKNMLLQAKEEITNEVTTAAFFKLMNVYHAHANPF